MVLISLPPNKYYVLTTTWQVYGYRFFPTFERYVLVTHFLS